MKPTPLLRAALLPALALLALSGCGGGDGGSDATPDPRVRALNLSPGATLDVSIDGETRIGDVTYLDEEFDGVARGAGSYDFGLRVSDTTELLAAEGYELQTGANYVYAAVGLAEFGEENAKRLRGTMVGYDRRSPGESKARVIAINAYVPESGTDPGPVIFEGPTDSPAFSFPSLEFGGAGALVLDAGPQTFEVRADGAEATLAEATISLQPGRTYVAAYSGRAGGTGDQAPAIRFLLVP